MDTAFLDELTRDERSSLILALQFLNRFTGRDTTPFPRENKRPVDVSADVLQKPRMQKLRESVARQLYADSLPKDIADRAVYAVAAGFATRHDINRLVANALRTYEGNRKSGKGPDCAWLIFWSSLKDLYEKSGHEFPTMSKELEPVPDSIIAKREAEERLHERVQKVLNED